MQERQVGAIPDTILLLEHTPTITLGKFAQRYSILAEESELRARGISVYNTDRGGDATYHGPGQLVSYIIMDLRGIGLGVRQYIYHLEDAVMNMLSEYSISSEKAQHPGIWVDSKQIASIGLGIRNGISYHGLAINVNPDLNNFSLIKPCGLSEVKATSMSEILGKAIPVDKVTQVLLKHMANILDINIESS